ncbi:hypothetical protein HYV85_02790 [Candidatus Woesearchaeota archaeon]|nr:hypothetical protein [Candidatus Woesearchaeota archaeon]
MENEAQEEIKQGDKTIKLVISFFANDLPNEKMAWQKGGVYALTNRSRGIRGKPYTPSKMFNRLEDIPMAIADVLKQCKVVIVERDKNTKKLQIIDY